MRSSRAISGVTIKNNRCEVKKICEITATLPFSEYDFCNIISFATGELGRIYNKLPLAELAQEKSKHTDADGNNNHNR